MRLRVLDRREQLPQLGVVCAHRDADDALAGGGHHRSGSSTTEARSAMPRRFKPASASSEAAHSPAASLSSRVCTLPRMRGDRQVRPRVQQLRLPPDRGGADHRAGGQAGERVGRVRRLAVRARGSARRAHPRACSVQASTMPGGSSVSRSFRLCTAKSMRPSASASWISLANRPLPPMSARRRSCTASPVVRMACSSNTSMPRSTGQNVVSRSRKARVCTSASGEPRVPTRSGSCARCGARCGCCIAGGGQSVWHGGGHRPVLLLVGRYEGKLQAHDHAMRPGPGYRDLLRRNRRGGAGRRRRACWRRPC